MKLYNTKTNKPARIGDSVTSFRGDHATILGWREPHKPSASGLIEVEYYDGTGGSYYPSVFGCEFRNLTTHTPGPWNVSITGKHNEVMVVVADGAPVADVTVTAARSIGTAHANADLIADAPELLAQLYSLCREVEAMQLDPLHPLSIQAQNARALMRKHS